ncbi:MAG: hypothetical protein WCK05_06210 [Planctomycetota bacterium]
MVIGTATVNDRPSPDVHRAGETYRVCCRECGDNKFHLHIAHGFGTLHEETGRRIYYAKCQRCGLSGKDLYDLMGQTRLGHVTIIPSASPVISAWPDDIYTSPGDCASLSDHMYPNAVKAGEYLAARGIDPKFVSDVYGWTYCWRGNPDLWGGMCVGRIIMCQRRFESLGNQTDRKGGSSSAGFSS